MALPTELDFTANPAATPARMDKAMEYIVARLRAVEAVQPEFLSQLDELKAVGLDRLAEVLIPIFNDANDIAAELEAKRDEWTDNNLPAELAAQATTAVVAEFADYRHRYLGAFPAAPTLDDEGNAVVVGAMYFNTVSDSMQVLGVGGWRNAGSVVNSILDRQSFTATGGETSITVAGGYDPGNIIVSLNGLVLAPSDVNVTSGTVITGLPAALAAGDEVTWTKFTAVTLANVYTKTQADSLFALATSVYTKTAADALLSAKANTADVYSKSAGDARYSQKGANLTDLTDAAAARTALGLGSSAVRGDSFFAKAADFAYSIGTTGSYTLPGGLIVKWGVSSASRTSDGYLDTIAFATAFPNACFGVQITAKNDAGNANADVALSASGAIASGFSVYANTTNNTATVAGFFWFAIGN